VHVKNIPFHCTWQDVKGVFSDCGNVIRVDMARDVQTGRSRGYCTVLFKEAESVRRAVDQVNGVELDGRALVVRADRSSSHS
jgi:RNA recognition motif-containing protein